MKPETPAICAVCGRTIEPGVAPDPSGRCERCFESASTRPEDRDQTNPNELPEQSQESARAAAVGRLRESYYEARALVATAESEPIHRGQLDWVLGVGGDDTRSAAPLDARTSELVVLWLEDLIRHLEELSAGGAASLPVEPGSPASPSQRAARGLHAATREFADAFRRASNAACGS